MAGKEWRGSGRAASWTARLVGAALIWAASAAPVPAQSDASPPLETVLADCAGCHGRDGRASEENVPHLRAQNFDYLVNQLRRFGGLAPGAGRVEENERTSPIVRGSGEMAGRSSDFMRAHARGLDLATIRGLARHYSNLQCEPPAQEADPAPPAGAAWCSDCHGRDKVKDLTNVPKLHGQRAGYLESQLLAFREAASRPGADPDNARSHHFMNRAARDLGAIEIRKIADFYAQQACVN